MRGRFALASIELVDVQVVIDESASMNLCQAGVLERVVRGRRIGDDIGNADQQNHAREQIIEANVGQLGCIARSALLVPVRIGLLIIFCGVWFDE